MSLVVVGVFAMFAVWSLNRAHVAADSHASELLHALDDGRSAQTLFKIQVQEWKNILLRGADEKDYARYLAAFESTEADVRRRLESLATRADQLAQAGVAESARALVAEHEGIGARYRQALAAGRATTWDPFVVDRSIRGIDRQFDEQLDQLAKTLLEQTDRQRQQDAGRQAARYATLRRFMGWSVTVAIAMVAMVLWTALRRTAR